MKHVSAAVADALARIPNVPAELRQSAHDAAVTVEAYRIATWCKKGAEWTAEIDAAPEAIRADLRAALEETHRRQEADKRLQEHIEAGAVVVINIRCGVPGL